MVKALFASLIGVAAAGGKLALTWEDCGTASTHGKTSDLQPSEIVIGQATDIVGTGTTDKKISSGSFTMKLTASLGIKETYEGKICEAKEFKMPLNIGTVSWAGMTCPVAVGPSTVKVGVKMASVLPSALAKADLALTAVDQDGEQAVCVNTHLQKEQLLASDIDCSKATCEEACTCSLDKCASQIDECLAAPNCASGQTCALGCACGDTACTLKCAASSPSIKALPVAKCINSNCNVGLKSKADIDCSKATCEEACTCSLDKCASQIDECLAAPNCASGQSCALGCACGDTACTLKCAASSPSIKALPVAKCINSNCNVALKSKSVDCSKATCQADCECSLQQCASEIDACLAAPNCAASQDCALACPCSDNTCMLKCAASSPSIKALPVAKCVNSKCGSASVSV